MERRGTPSSGPAGAAARPAPRLDHLDPGSARRVLLTLSCSDADDIPKVPGAGEVREVAGTSVQVMHNGVLVEEGAYCGDWMTEIIRCLRGHHEPQEERVFHALVERLRDVRSPVMLELGSFWAYYSLWFCSALAGATAVAMEPDADHLDVGRRNAALNGLEQAVRFVAGAVGEHPGEPVDFVGEVTGRLHRVPQHDIGSLLDAAGAERADLVLADVQGAEVALLGRAAPDLRDGRVRFLVVSTHHHAIAGDPLVHQRCLRILEAAGAHVVAEHTVAESFSGDGLIAVSFDEQDRDLRVPLSTARARDSLFGELEPDLAEAWQRAAEAEARADRLEAEVAAARAERDRAAAELVAVRATKLWRWSRRPRELYGRLAGAARDLPRRGAHR